VVAITLALLAVLGLFVLPVAMYLFLVVLAAIVCSAIRRAKGTQRTFERLVFEAVVRYGRFAPGNGRRFPGRVAIIAWVSLLLIATSLLLEGAPPYGILFVGVFSLVVLAAVRARNTRAPSGTRLPGRAGRVEQDTQEVQQEIAKHPVEPPVKLDARDGSLDLTGEPDHDIEQIAGFFEDKKRVLEMFLDVGPCSPEVDGVLKDAAEECRSSIDWLGDLRKVLSSMDTLSAKAEYVKASPWFLLSMQKVASALRVLNESQKAPDGASARGEARSSGASGYPPTPYQDPSSYRESPPGLWSARQEEQRAAELFVKAGQLNAVRHYLNDVADSKRAGADLEEIRRRTNDPSRPLDFFGE